MCRITFYKEFHFDFRVTYRGANLTKQCHLFRVHCHSMIPGHSACLPTIVLYLLKFTQWVLRKCGTCYELNGKTNTTHSHTAIATCEYTLICLTEELHLMGLGPTNWCANAEQPAAGRLEGFWELQACAPGGASGTPGALASNQSADLPFAGYLTLGRPLNLPKPWFPSLWSEVKNVSPSDGTGFNKMIPVNWLYKPESTIQMKSDTGSRAQFERWLKSSLRTEITLLWTQILLHHTLWLWAVGWTCLCLRLLIYKMEIITPPTT